MLPTQKELESVLQGWLLLSIADRSPIPEIDGNRIEVGKSPEMPAIGPVKLGARAQFREAAGTGLN